MQSPELAEGNTVIVVAAVDVAINLATALMFMSGRKGDLNVRAAFMHMAGDAAIALGVVVVGIVIVYAGWLWLDPAVSLVIAVLVIVGTWGLLRDSVNLALQGVPEGVQLGKVREYLASVPGVAEVHDLHVRGLSTTETALTAHLVMPVGYPGDALRQEICAELREHFAIGHATLQIELGDSGHPCELAPDTGLRHFARRDWSLVRSRWFVALLAVYARTAVQELAGNFAAVQRPKSLVAIVSAYERSRREGRTELAASAASLVDALAARPWHLGQAVRLALSIMPPDASLAVVRRLQMDGLLHVGAVKGGGVRGSRLSQRASHFGHSVERPFSLANAGLWRGASNGQLGSNSALPAAHGQRQLSGGKPPVAPLRRPTGTAADRKSVV